jgi:inosine-uridine nucleoside N-ribohydrolase
LRDPSLGRRIRVACVGGNLSSWGRWPPFWPHEFNLSQDPAAAHTLFASEAARLVYPLDVCRVFTVGMLELRDWGRRSPLGAYLSRHAWRWLVRASLRYRRLRFPLWDLIPALDALGLLPGAHQTRRLACVGRGRLVDDPDAPPSEVLASLEPRAALAAFRAML